MNVSGFNIFSEVLRLLSFFFIPFLSFLLWQWFTQFCLQGHLLSCLLVYYWFLLVDFFHFSYYFINLFVFFFSSSRYLLKFSCVFSILSSILFPRSWSPSLSLFWINLLKVAYLCFLLFSMTVIDFHFGDCGIIVLTSDHSFCSYSTDGQKACASSCWEEMAVGKTGSCSQ